MPEGSNIIVVDSDGTRRERLRADLSRDCPVVHVASNGAEALVRARELPRQYPNVVLVDPVAVDGKLEAFASEMRSVATGEIIVIVMTNIAVKKIDGIAAAVRPDLTDQRLRSVIAGQLTDLAARKITAMTVVLIALQPLRPRGSPIETGGTGILVRTGQAQILMTAGHVARELARPDLRWVMGGDGGTVRIPPDARILGIDEARDIAAVELPADFDAAILGRRFYEPSQWPPERAVANEPALFVGFPGQIRGFDGEKVSARGMLLTSRIQLVTEEMFVLTADEDSEINSNGPQLTAFGGISGAPVFASKERGLTLVGIVNACTSFDNGVLGVDGQPARKGVGFYAAHADVIGANGELAQR